MVQEQMGREMKKKVYTATVEIKLVLITTGLNDATLEAMDAVTRLKNVEAARVVTVEER